ncbi:hypothetical protein K438DRAFT_1771554 [Mycena galopus ATCC 62051]|nr:hypothetical protein K438DRAFT_1771554 [Mycena galopus ATCC 62051]
MNKNNINRTQTARCGELSDGRGEVSDGAASPVKPLLWLLEAGISAEYIRFTKKYRYTPPGLYWGTECDSYNNNALQPPLLQNQPKNAKVWLSREARIVISTAYEGIRTLELSMDAAQSLLAPHHFNYSNHAFYCSTHLYHGLMFQRHVSGLYSSAIEWDSLDNYCALF